MCAGVGAYRDVGLDGLLAAPVARGAQLGVVHPAADAVPDARVISVGHGHEPRPWLGLVDGSVANAGGVHVVVVAVFEAVALGVVDLDALAGAPAAGFFRDERLDASLALLGEAG